MNTTIPAVAEQDQPSAASAHRVGRLKPRDRCDSCGARAYAAAEINGTDLLFCGHHFTLYESAIRAVADEVLDERWQIAQEEADRRAYVEPPAPPARRRGRYGR